MASTINASTSGAGGVITTADSSGVLQLQTAGTTAVTVDASQNVGIGTSSPANSVQISKATYPTVQLTETTANTSFIMQYHSALACGYLTITGAQPMVFKTSDTERMRIDTSGNLLFNSGYGSVATAYGCRAWVNFNGTSGASPVIRASGGVTSVTRTGTGAYTVALSFTMPDANYSVTACTTAYAVGITTTSTTSFTLTNFNTTNTVNTDSSLVCVAVFR